MTTILILDVAGLLDRSQVGSAAARSLEKAWREAQGQPEAQRRELLAQLEARRDGLRAKLLERARPVIAELAQKKGASLVVQRDAVVWSQGEDITAQVISRVDAGGALSA
jgi:Skp family chaperone for outer membrane proteins